MVEVNCKALRNCRHIDRASPDATTAQTLSLPIIRHPARQHVRAETLYESVAVENFGASCPMVQVIQDLYHALHNV